MNKQIEEMAKAIEQARIKATDTTNSMNYGFGGWYAKELYNAGYRKASDIEKEIEDLKAISEQYRKQFEEARTDVAREIFEEIEKVRQLHTIGNIDGVTLNVRLYELKKKYTEEEKDNDRD